MSTQEKHTLGYDILYDKENKVADAFGIRFVVPEKESTLYKKLGVDLEKINGDTSLTLPVPATYVIRKDGTVAYAFVDADHTKRLDPEDIIKALKNI